MILNAMQTTKDDESLFLVDPFENLKAKSNDILYIENVRHTTYIHTVKGTFRSNQAFSSLMLELSKDEFYQCHRSYIVQIGKIAAITKNEITLEDGSVLPIARGKWEETNQRFLSFYRIPAE